MRKYRKGKKKYREYTRDERIEEIENIRKRMNLVGLNADSFPYEFKKIEIIFRLFIDAGYEYNDMIPMADTGRSLHIITHNNTKHTVLAILKKTNKEMADKYDEEIRQLEGEE